MKLFAYINQDEVVLRQFSKDSLLEVANDYCQHLENEYADKGWVFLEEDQMSLFDLMCDQSVEDAAKTLITFMKETNEVSDLYYFPQVVEI